MTPALYARSLSVELDGRIIVSDCSFDIGPGEFVAIAGPNGAGKSTLLRALCGLLPYTGSIRLGESELAGLDRLKRAQQIAWLPQQGQIFWPMRVRDVVMLGRLPFGASLQRPGAADRALVESAISACGIGDFAERPVVELSGGELARVLLARAFAVDAPLVLVDEPTASLDPAQQLRIMGLLADYAARGRIVLSVSHDIALALRFCTRMIALEGGRVAGDSTPAGLVDNGDLGRIFAVRFHRADAGGAPAVAVTPAGEFPLSSS